MITSANESLAGRVIAVIGGSGFLGTHLAQELLSRGARLRIASRNPERAHSLKPLGDLGQVQFTRCDVRAPETLPPVVAGAYAVINLVGAFSGNLDAIQGQGAGRIAAAARQAGATAFLHVSAIGANAESKVNYARTKANGETAVWSAFPAATIMRPAILFGSDDEFVMMFGSLIATFPVLPVFAPKAELQPLFVVDAADALAIALADHRRHGGKTYEIAGPEVMTTLELNRRIAQAQHRKRRFIELSDSVSKMIAMLPGTPITTDQFELLRSGNVPSGNCPGLSELGVSPRPLELFLDRWMLSFRRRGRFGEGKGTR